MNFQTNLSLYPLKVLIVNPLTPVSQLTIIKILSGAVFGRNQLIDLVLLVYSNEKDSAEILKCELTSCAFPCNNFIEVSSDLPSLSDADIFCFITNHLNPNKFDVEKINTEEQFDTLYYITKIAHNLFGKTNHDTYVAKKGIKNSIRKIKPLIVADGLDTLDILASFSNNLPKDILFCPTPITVIAKSVLGDHLKVQCNMINDVYVWAGNNEVLHVEVDKPLIVNDTVGNSSNCDWEAVSKDRLNSFNLDHTQFSASWMKKEFIEKVTQYASKNPHGCIYRAAEFAKTLQAIWISRSRKTGDKVYCNLGVISDGSLGTVKGLPYVLPLIICGESWTVNKYLEGDSHLQNEIKRMNKMVTTHHRKLISYCKKIIEDNINKEHLCQMPGDNESSL